MPRLTDTRIDQIAPDRINTDLMLDELRAKIALAEYEHKATFEKSELEKKTNFHSLLDERRKNKVRRSSMFSECPQSLFNVPDGANISAAFKNSPENEKLFIVRKKMPVAVVMQDNKTCDAIKRYNLKVYEKERKLAEVGRLEEELRLLAKEDEKIKQEDMNSPEAQKIRLLENSLEKLKMKLSSARLVAHHYDKILSNLKEETQQYPWKLDLLEAEVIEHQKSLADALSVNQGSINLMEKSIQDTKEFHEEYFESKKNRDKMLVNTRRDVDKAHREVKGHTEKPKQVRPQVLSANTPHDATKEDGNKDDDAPMMQQRYEAQRKKRLEYEGTASFLKNACKVSSKEEILPAITQQHEVQRALKLQIENLENQKAVLEFEKEGVSREYRQLKFFGEKKISDGERLIEQESDPVKQLTEKVKAVSMDTKAKQALLGDIDIACSNYFMLLQKCKVDPQARSLMTGELEKDFLILSEKLEQLTEQINYNGRVTDFLENPDFLDYMEDTLPGSNTRVEIRGDEEEPAELFDDEHGPKQASLVLGRDEIKKASQKIIEKNQGKLRRKKKK